MYIKFNKRLSKRHECQVFQFSVVESYRQDGKVKHRQLCFLAWLPEKYFNAPDWNKAFWEKCTKKLQYFPESSRHKLRLRLETIVPRLSEGMYKITNN